MGCITKPRTWEIPIGSSSLTNQTTAHAHEEVTSRWTNACSLLLAFTLGQASRDAAFEQSRDENKWLAFREQFKIGLSRLFTLSPALRRILGLKDGRIVAYWSYLNSDLMTKTRNQLRETATQDKLRELDIIKVEVCKTCKISESSQPFQSFFIDQGDVESWVTCDVLSNNEGALDYVLSLPEDNGESPRSPTEQSPLLTKRPASPLSECELRVSKRPMMVRNLADNFARGIVEFSLQELLSFERTDYSRADIREQVLQAAKTKFELASSPNAMAIIKDKEKPDLRLAVNIQEVLSLHRMIVLSLLGVDRLEGSWWIYSRSPNSGELDKDTLRDRHDWITTQESRWVFPECLTTLRSYADPLRSALRNFRREMKTLVSLLEIILKAGYGNRQQPDRPCSEKVKARSTAIEAKVSGSEQKTVKSEELQALKKSLAKTRAELEEALRSRALTEDETRRARDELEKANRLRDAAEEDARLAQTVLKEELQKRTSSEDEAQQARLKLDEAVRLSASKEVEARQARAELEEAVRSRTLAEDEARQAGQQNKATEAQLVNALCARATAESALKAELSRRLRAEQMLNSLSNTIANMETALDTRFH